MSTRAHATTLWLAREWEKLYDSAVFSGIVGDRAHRARGGFHLSRADNPAGNFSVVRPQDRSGNGPSDVSAGIDMSMGHGDMVLCTTRLARLYSNVDDPRRKYLNAFNGWLGSGDAIRYDVYARKRKKASPDHKCHVHLEQRRLYVPSMTAAKAILSGLRGDSVARYLTTIGVHPAPPAPPATGKKPLPPPAPLYPPYPGRVLRRDDHQSKPDPAVLAFQARMRARGWTSIGPADGMAGARFADVVTRWQRLCKLPPDGEVGPKTWPTPWTRALGS